MLIPLLFITAGFGWLSWKQLHTGLWILIATLPSYLLRVSVAGIPTTLLELMLITWIGMWIVRRKTLPVAAKSRGVLLPILLVLMAATLSIVIAPDFVAALGIWKAYFLEPMILFFLIRHEVEHHNLNRQTILEALGVSALIISILGLLQWGTGIGIAPPWDIERRITSLFPYPNAVGLFLGPITIIAALQSTKRTFWMPVGLLSFIAIILAQSEAAIVSVVITLTGFLIINKKTRLIGSSVGMILILATLLIPTLQQKLLLQDYSGQVRLSQWEETVELLKDRWLLGTGLSGYPTALIPYHDATHLEIFQYPHTWILNIWVELGLLGVLSVLWLTVSWIRSRNWKDPITILCAAALLQILIHGLVDVPYFKNDLAVLTWMLLALSLPYAVSTHSQT